MLAVDVLRQLDAVEHGPIRADANEGVGQRRLLPGSLTAGREHGVRFPDHVRKLTTADHRTLAVVRESRILPQLPEVQADLDGLALLIQIKETDDVEGDFDHDGVRCLHRSHTLVIRCMTQDRLIKVLHLITRDLTVDMCINEG